MLCLLSFLKYDNIGFMVMLTSAIGKASKKVHIMTVSLNLLRICRRFMSIRFARLKKGDYLLGILHFFYSLRLLQE